MENYRGARPVDKGPKRNTQIRAQKVLLIDAAGENRGEVDTAVALAEARAAGLDLIEVSPDANPPVARIIDYAKYVYELNKKLKKNRSKSKLKAMKEFKFTPVIEEHDTNIRVKRAKEYLEKGHNVRITMFRKGRQSQDLAKQTFKDILTKFSDYSSIETEPKLEGRKLFITLKHN